MGINLGPPGHTGPSGIVGPTGYTGFGVTGQQGYSIMGDMPQSKPLQKHAEEIKAPELHEESPGLLGRLLRWLEGRSDGQ